MYICRVFNHRLRTEVSIIKIPTHFQLGGAQDGLICMINNLGTPLRPVAGGTEGFFPSGKLT